MLKSVDLFQIPKRAKMFLCDTILGGGGWIPSNAGFDVFFGVSLNIRQNKAVDFLMAWDAMMLIVTPL